MSVTSGVSATLNPEVVGKDKQIVVALATGAVGVVIAVMALIVLLNRVQVAAVVLDARVLFGTPIAEIDTFKILAITVESFVWMAYGAFVAVVGGGIALTVLVRNRPL